MSEEGLMVPPNSPETEQALLGAVMIDGAVWDHIADKLREEDFYRREHKLIFETMHQLTNEGDPLDAVTVAEALSNSNKLQDAGGLTYLGEIHQSTSTAANALHYAKLLKELSLKRKIVHIGSRMQERGCERNGRSANDLAQEAEGELLEAFSAGMEGELVHIRAGLQEVVERVQQAHEVKHGEREAERETKSGYPDLDELLNGFQPGNLYVLAARPSMGKTALALNLAEDIAVRQAGPVGIFSIEMRGRSLLQRMISSLSRIDLQCMLEADITHAQWPFFSRAVQQLSESPIYIDDSATLTPMQMRARARRANNRYGPFGLIILDYLQYMHIPGIRANQRVAEVTQISRSLKALAKELDVPVLALSQLNRSMSSRTDKRPTLTDLRDSGAIEQDADAVLFIHREEVHNPQTPDKGIAEIIVGKHRDGPTGTVRLTTALERMRFESFAAPQFQERYSA